MKQAFNKHMIEQQELEQTMLSSFQDIVRNAREHMLCENCGKHTAKEIIPVLGKVCSSCYDHYMFNT